jgi:hypothetical protein
MSILSGSPRQQQPQSPCGRGFAVALVSDYPARDWLADVIDQVEQCQLANWLDDPLPRTGVAV